MGDAKSLVFTFYGTSGLVRHGIVISRDGRLLEVAMDSTENRPAYIAWINPTAQIGRTSLSMESFAPRHPAIKKVLSGDIEGARVLLRQEELQRQKEREA